MKSFLFFLLVSASLLLNAQKTAMPTSTLRLGYGLGVVENGGLSANVSHQLQMEYAFSFTKHWAIKTGAYWGDSHINFHVSDCPVGYTFAHYIGNTYSVSIPLIINTFYHVKPHHKWNYFTGIGLLYNYNYRSSFSNYDWEGKVHYQKTNFSLKEGQKLGYGLEIGLRRWFLNDYFAGLSLNRFVSFNYGDSFFSQSHLNFFIGKTLNVSHKKQ